MYRIAASRHRGDPFSIGGLLGGVAKFAGGLLPGPAGMVLRAAGGILGPKKPQVLPHPSQVITQIGPGGMVYKRTEVGAQLTPGTMARGSVPSQFRRRINPANVKALRRAIRRQDSFVKLAKSVGMTSSCHCGGRAKLKSKRGRRR